MFKSRSVLFLLLSAVFLIAGIWTSYSSFRPASVQTVARKISSNLKQEIKLIEEDAKNILDGLARDPEFEFAITSGYSFFIYYDLELIYWSDNMLVPTARQVADSFMYKLLKTSNGDYLARKWEITDRKFLLSLIPLYKNYPISNDYLGPQWNSKIFPEGDIDILEPGASIGTPVCLDTECPFRISVLTQGLQAHERTQLGAVILLTLSLVLFLIFFFKGLQIIKLHHPDWGFVYLISVLWIIRVLMIEFGFPHELLQSPLFDPQNFASSSMNRSLGDLILNELGLLMVCYYFFSNYYRFRILRTIRRIQILIIPVYIFYALCILFAALYPFVVVQTLYNNSSIILDISQSLYFDSLRVAAFLAIAIAWACSFLFSHAFARLLIANRNRGGILMFFGAGIVIFIMINRFTGQNYLSSLILGALYFLVVYFFKLYSSLHRIGYITFSYLFFAIFFLSLNGAYAIQFFSRKEKIENQFRFASNFLIDRDYFGEYLLHEVGDKISNDAFSQARIASPFLSKDAVRQKIRQVFLPSYFNKYDVEILLFGPAGTPYENRTTYSFSELLSLYSSESFKTDYSGVYFVNSPSSDVTQRYLVYVPIQRGKVITGYVFLVLSMKKIIPENVYPELLVDHRFQQFYRTQDLSYAVFSSRNLLFSSGDFNYELFFDRSWLQDPMLRTKGVTRSGYDHIAIEDQNGRIAIVSSRSTPVIFVSSNFSFLLVLGLSVILIVLLIQGLINYAKGSKIFFSARIQLYLNLAFFLPLIVVSITTLSLTSVSSQQQLQNEYLNKARNFSNQLVSALNNYLEAREETTIDFENQLTDLSKLSDLDANVYSPQGTLLASSQPLIFSNGLLSTYINPEALLRIRSGENLFITSEQVGKLTYFVSYASLKSPQSGKLIGILGIPFFQSVYSLEKVQITILANILNIFAVIFIILLVLSYFVSQWLTFPLKFITQTLSRTSLTKTNQPLTWKSDDEIGLMVKEYNQMLYKLSESKAELEQTQRERAWREIAQQVAHEIKNPLTPMKLTLQQLERSMQAGQHTQEKTEKALSSLLTQVDTLNDIASSFSAFAKMPEPVIQRFELISLLRRIINLHSPSGNIHFKPAIKELYAMGDESLLGRIFSNMILNAFQAARPGVPLQVEVTCEKIGGKGLIGFHDNGKGISKEFSDRVFVPYFTTKKSGSGLGLAISRQGIEHMGGKIWFESAAGEGTTFFIELVAAE